ncbi:hypothetical protein MASR1M45_03120 [Candidatus Kapaibacterium sp.]
MARLRFSKNKVISALQQSKGIKLYACEILACSRVTLDKYIEKFPEIQNVINDVKDQTKDRCERILLTEFIDNKEVSSKQRLDALKFYLKTQARDRGYIEQSNFDFTSQGDSISEIKITIADKPNKDE